MSREALVFDYVVGALTPAERAQVQATRLYDRALDADVKCTEEALSPLALAPDQAAVPARLWDRIETAIEAHAAEAPTMTTELFEEGDWRPYQDGVELKPLWGGAGYLVRCAPGSLIKPHDHFEDERVLVMTGELQVGGRRLRAGDTQLSLAGTSHGLISSPSGCVLLVQHAREAASASA